MLKLIISILISFILGLSIQAPSMQLGLEFNGYRITGNIFTWIGCILICAFIIQLIRYPFLWINRYHNYRRDKKQRQDKQFLIDIIQAYINRNTLLYPKLLEKAHKVYSTKDSTYWLIHALLAPTDKIFQHLCEYQNTILGGLHGLIKTAQKEDDANLVQHLLDKISKENRKLPWVQKAYFQLSVQENEWDDALEHLEKLKWILPPKEYNQHKACCLFKNGKIRQAYKLDPNNPAIALEWAKLNPKRAEQILFNLWQNQPNWSGYLYLKNMIKDKTAKQQIKVIQKLIHKNQKHKLSLLAIADLYLTRSEPIKAKEYMDEYFEMYPLTHKSAQTMASIERMAWNHEDIAQQWESKTIESEDETAWKCTHCGNTFSTWHAVCPSCRAFNTLK